MAGGSERTNSGVQVGNNIIAQPGPRAVPNCALGGNPRGDARRPLSIRNTAHDPISVPKLRLSLDSGRFVG